MELNFCMKPFKRYSPMPRQKSSLKLSLKLRVVGCALRKNSILLQFCGKIGLVERYTSSPGQWSLLIFSINDPKQNARSFLTEDIRFSDDGVLAFFRS